jgi:hypothetical protein
MGDKKNETWFVQTTPWEGCPFKIQIVAVTCNGQEDAVSMFKKFYSLADDVKIDTIIEVPVVKGILIEDSLDVPDNRPASKSN